MKEMVWIGNDVNFKNLKVLITGHTGFIGSWLTEWLLLMGADVMGYSLDPPTIPNLYDILDIKSKIVDVRADVKDFNTLSKSVSDFSPEVIFHLAAQPIVLRSYDFPVETFETNVMGTVNLLESSVRTKGVKSVVVMTSDKTYRNKGWEYPYRETDELGGRDPYSASKSCADIVVNSYRESFFGDAGIGLSSARAGNVIGGGDFAERRLVPDILRSLLKDEPLQLRNPLSVRPWQHVLDLVNGLLKLAQKMNENPVKYSSDWNFGPCHQSKSVEDVVKLFFNLWGSGRYQFNHVGPDREEKSLSLDVSRATTLLNWKPILDFELAVAQTAKWYKAFANKSDPRNVTLDQIKAYIMNSY